MTPAEYKSIVEFTRSKKRNKYRARKTKVDGIGFASKAESRRYAQLKLLESQGIIQSLACQPRFTFAVNGQPLLFPNGRQAAYSADFQYFEPGRGLVVEDVKSSATKTEAYALRAALFRVLYPQIVFVEIESKTRKPRKLKSQWLPRKVQNRSAA